MDADARTPACLRVLLADPHDHFRAALRGYLHTLSGVLVVAEATSAPDALQAAERATPDVALVDLGLCVDTGLVESLKHLAASPRVLVTSVANDPEYARRATGLGADVWISKDDLDRIRSEVTGALPGPAAPSPT